MEVSEARRSASEPPLNPGHDREDADVQDDEGNQQLDEPKALFRTQPPHESVHVRLYFFGGTKPATVRSSRSYRLPSEVFCSVSRFPICNLIVCLPLL